ncbi:MAG: hypothetical protein HZA92_00265 [Verrucomicrobia bacterium]|nr:hypothetical protein [Verrucomicrobiota bacterium]
MFGLYLVDRFGNKELIHRDREISSLWPVPLRARLRPPVLPSQLAAHADREGTFFYGTFDPADQARQRRGERIAEARLE